jgi:hypothetical protein
MMPQSPPPLEYATTADLRIAVAELKTAIAEIKTAISDLEVRLQRLVLTTLIAMTAIFGGLVTVLKLFG